MEASARGSRPGCATVGSRARIGRTGAASSRRWARRRERSAWAEKADRVDPVASVGQEDLAVDPVDQEDPVVGLPVVDLPVVDLLAAAAEWDPAGDLALEEVRASAADAVGPVDSLVRGDPVPAAIARAPVKARRDPAANWHSATA